MKVVTILGARPQFIKSAPVCWAFAASKISEKIIHTGQHYDENMSDIFFQEMRLPQPSYHLGIGSDSHGSQTGQMLIEIEKILLKEAPDWLLVYGDTNSTLAGALAAAKLNIPLAHVEAGLRSYNRTMPEEHNRVLTDHCSNILFCPTRTAVTNLEKEGLTHGVYEVGDTMLDATLKFVELAEKKSSILARLELQPKKFSLATIHRAYNTDNKQSLSAALLALAAMEDTVVLPLHPRTRKKLQEFSLNLPKNILVIDPVGYLDMLLLEKSSQFILTDSGGIQKEAYFLGVPCMTLRPETEWVETLTSGWNQLVGLDANAVIKAKTYYLNHSLTTAPSLFGHGTAATEIVKHLEEQYE